MPSHDTPLHPEPLEAVYGEVDDPYTHQDHDEPFDGIQRHPLNVDAFGALQLSVCTRLANSLVADPRPVVVVTLDGQILDGAHLDYAARQAGVDPRYLEYPGEDPRAHVARINLARRHQSPGQRAVAIMGLYALHDRGRPTKSAPSADFADDGRELRFAGELAELAGVSVRSIHQAESVRQAGLAQMVLSGDMSLKQAYSQATRRGTDQTKRETQDRPANSRRTESQWRRLHAELLAQQARIKELEQDLEARDSIIASLRSDITKMNQLAPPRPSAATQSARRLPRLTTRQMSMFELMESAPNQSTVTGS